MQDNHAMKKLKMHFAKIAGLAKAQTFKALTISARQAKARKMLDGEAGQRLKAFLKSKLAGVLRRCYTAIIANHDNIAAENLKNNDKAKKVGMMLEKLARGMVHRIFTAFIRHFQECAEERAAQDAINARLSGLDEANRAKLKVFLMGKEKAQLMMFFKQWVMVASEKGLMELYEMLDKEEADVKQEQEYREEQQAKNLALREETAATTAVRDELAAELMGVAGDVGNVHNEAQYDE